MVKVVFQTLRLVLPVLIPSWRFFKGVDPSPRIQWRFIDDQSEPYDGWKEFRPRPQILTPLAMIRRLFWNPSWNESLYLVSCAERFAQTSDPHSIDEIRQRVNQEIRKQTINETDGLIQFRLIFIQGVGESYVEEIVFVSVPYALDQDELI